MTEWNKLWTLLISNSWKNSLFADDKYKIYQLKSLGQLSMARYPNFFSAFFCNVASFIQL